MSTQDIRYTFSVKKDILMLFPYGLERIYHESLLLLLSLKSINTNLTTGGQKQTPTADNNKH